MASTNLQIPSLDTAFRGERTEKKPSRKPLLMMTDLHVIKPLGALLNVSFE